MSKLKLWLIRHGESSANAGIWSPNPAQAHLTDSGKKQAQNAAAKIVEPPQLIITSPLIRAQESAQYIMQKWPDTPTCIWPIQEFICLSPTKLNSLTPLERESQVNHYWEHCDPFYCDGEDSESFASFLQRVLWFHEQLNQYQGFVVVVGHGQFFKAYLLGLQQGFHATVEWMKLFRHQEVTRLIRNSEILELILP